MDLLMITASFQVAVLVLLYFVPAISGDGITTTPIKHNPGIYYEDIGRTELYSHEWKVVVFYDLKNLKTTLTYLEKHIKEINNLCEYLSDQQFSTTVQTCNATVQEINQLMFEIENKRRFLSDDTREKRSLFDAIGIISKSLFGTLNEEDAKFYDSQILKIKSNEQHLLSLIKNQTIIVETTANIFNKSLNSIELQYSVLSNKFRLIKTMISELTNTTRNLYFHSELESLTTLTAFMIMRCQNTMDTMIDLLSEARRGKPHPAIISPTQLERILTSIRKELPQETRLPAVMSNNNLLSVYKISHTSSTIIGGRILYELRIPLPFKETYQLYKLIPLPTRSQENFVFIQPSMSYLLIDYAKEHYYDMTSDELSICITEDHNKFLCRVAHPIFNLHARNDRCELKLLARGNSLPDTCDVRQSNYHSIWVQLSQVNKWLYSVYDNLTVDVICKDQITPSKLSGTGILEISGDCYLRTHDLTIQAYSSDISQIKNSYIPPINISEHLKNFKFRTFNISSQAAVLRYTSQDEFKKLSQRITSLKQEEAMDLEPISGHTIHHYTVIYLLLLTLLIYLTYRVFERFRKTRKGNKPVQVEEIHEMSDVGENPKIENKIESESAQPQSSFSPLYHT